MFGNLIQQHRRRHRLQHPGLPGAMQSSRVHGDQDVGWRLGALAQQPLDQLVGAAFDQVHLDTGELLELAVEFQIDVVVTVRVDVYRALARSLGGRGRGRSNQHGRCQQQPYQAIHHGVTFLNKVNESELT